MENGRLESVKTQRIVAESVEVAKSVISEQCKNCQTIWNANGLVE